MPFFKDTRNELAAPLERTKADILKLPITPVKKTIVCAMLDYYIEIIKERNLVTLTLFTHHNERIADIKNITKAIRDLSDDNAIAYVRQHIQQLQESSLFRQKALIAVNNAQADLTNRRNTTQNIIVGASAILLFSNPLFAVVGASAILAYATNKLSPVSNELLEIYDSTGLQAEETSGNRKSPCERLVTTYHRLNKM
jgi:hypothetical protein